MDNGNEPAYPMTEDNGSAFQERTATLIRIGTKLHQGLVNRSLRMLKRQ